MVHYDSSTEDGDSSYPSSVDGERSRMYDRHQSLLSRIIGDHRLVNGFSLVATSQTQAVVYHVNFLFFFSSDGIN